MNENEAGCNKALTITPFSTMARAEQKKVNQKKNTANNKCNDEAPGSCWGEEQTASGCLDTNS